MNLDLEYFERIEVNPRLILLRVGGQPAPDEDVALIVTDGEDSHRSHPLDGSVAVEPDGRWRAAFPVRRELADATGVSFALDAGERIDLPPPTSRVLDEDEESPNGAPAAAATAAVEEVEVPVEEPVDEGARHEAVKPTTEQPRPTRRGNTPLLVATILLGALAAAAVIAFALSHSGSDDGGATEQPAASTPAASTPAATPSTLAPLPGEPAGISARVARLGANRIALRVSGLPAGRYEAWMFTSVIDAAPLATLHGPSDRVTFTLPPRAAEFRYLDVSHEDDANPNHSGRSVLRLPMSSLTRG